MHNTIINAPGRYYDAKTADWKKLARKMDPGVQQWAANCCGSDVLQRHFTQRSHSEKWFYASLHFIYFWALWNWKKNTQVNKEDINGWAMDAPSRHASSRTRPHTVHPAAHGKQTQIMVVTGCLKQVWEGWQRSPFKQQQATRKAASHVTLSLNTWAGLQ